MNKAILIGNLTREPETRTTPNGIAVTTFTVAVQRRFKQDGQQQADFLNVVTWRALAENCGKYLSKGSKVGVVGRIETRNYEDKNGIKRYVTEIVADEVSFLSSKGSEQREPTEDFSSEPEDFQPLDDAELPF